MHGGNIGEGARNVVEGEHQHVVKVDQNIAEESLGVVVE